MKIKIKRYTAIAAWRWEGVEDDDLCGICRLQFDATCPGCRFPGEDCPLTFGKCQHTFHTHCLDGWLSENSTCPMCRQQFERKMNRASPERPAQDTADTQEAEEQESNAQENAGQNDDVEMSIG